MPSHTLIDPVFRHILCTEAMDFHDRQGKEVVTGFVSSEDSPVAQVSDVWDANVVFTETSQLNFPPNVGIAMS